MSRLLCVGGTSTFDTVRMGLEMVGVHQVSEPCSALLQWHDSLKCSENFSNLRPWQVTNRIPSLHVLTKKASLAKIINNVSKIFPKEYSFMPKQYIIPDQYDEFCKMLKTTDKTWILKPDEGSLGVGIQIIEPGMNIEIPREDAVAQEYIESATLHNKKFDLRIYVLIASVDPLRIYVYRDGLARFCSEEVGVDPVYSRLTNVTLNKHHNSNFKDISQMIKDVFPKLKAEGVDIDKLWSRIDDVIVKTILSSINILSKSEETKCPSCIYSRCFQILGFDILLDKEWNPYVLEVNYRPNLDYHRGVERRMKSTMIRDAVRIAVPLKAVQAIFLSRKNSWDSLSWRRFLLNHENIKSAILGEICSGEQSSNFQKVFISGIENSENQRIYDVVKAMPVQYVPGLDIATRFIHGGEA